MSSLHNAIMNLPCCDARASDAGLGVIAYKFGHRDARHAAAELAIQADKRIEELERDAARFVFEHSNPDAMLNIELLALKHKEPCDIAWCRAQIDLAMGAK